jgi:hypothetical protein
MMRAVALSMFTAVTLPFNCTYERAYAGTIRTIEIYPKQAKIALSAVPEKYLQGMLRKVLRNYKTNMDCGSPTVSFLVSESGIVSKVKVESTRGCSAGDLDGIEAVKRASPFEKVPVSCEGLKVFIDLKDDHKRFSL